MRSPDAFPGVHLVNDASSFAASIIRLGQGLARYPAAGRQPSKMLELWEYEGCPYCRKVREALCELDLDVFVHPVAHGSRRRQRLEVMGGRVQVPYLVDPNTGTTMYESDDINEYLHARYGTGGTPNGLRAFPLANTIDSFVATAVRLGRGIRVVPGLTDKTEPHLPLQLFNMEGSPYCRKVREVLSELDLEHVVINVPRGSRKRAELRERAGKMQVPYLVDPNTGTKMLESDAITTYLREQYGPTAA